MGHVTHMDEIKKHIQYFGGKILENKLGRLIPK